MMSKLMKKRLINVLATLVMLFSYVANAETTEVVAKIVKVDIEQSQITLGSKRYNEMPYKAAFDIRISLENGETAGVANLRKGDLVTAVVDSGSSVVHVIDVLK